MATWVKLHDNFTENPKVLAAGEDAAWLYVCGLLYCSRNLTDGRIPATALKNLTARKNATTLACVLVREGLWTESTAGWEIHDYTGHQRTKAQVESQRDKWRDRQERHRAVTPVSPRDKPASHAVSHADVTPPETETETDTNPPTPPPQSGRDSTDGFDFEHHPVPKIPDEIITDAEHALDALKRQMRPALYAVPQEAVT